MRIKAKTPKSENEKMEQRETELYRTRKSEIRRVGNKNACVTDKLKRLDIKINKQR